MDMDSVVINVKELCRIKGLTMTDVANRMGVSPSNLLSSVKGNPKLSTLYDIADALQVPVSELLSMLPDSAQGLVIIDGQILQLSRPAATTVQLPTFDRFDTLRKEVKDFINKSIKGSEPATKMGLVQTMEFFSLVYDPEAAKFYLSLCYADGKTLTSTYDKMEYTVWPEDESNDNATWNKTDLSEAIISDIEGRVPMAINIDNK